MTDFLDTIERLLGEATPGEWRVPKKHARRLVDWRGFLIGKTFTHTKGINFEIPLDEAEANAALIGELKNNAPKLLAIARAAEAVLDRWDSPAWKDQPATAVFMNELRKALRGEASQ